MIDKVRIKKYQQSRIELWCKALEVSESRFVEDALTFYLRHLEGKQSIPSPVVSVPNYPIKSEIETQTTIETDNPDEYDGGIEL